MVKSLYLVCMGILINTKDLTLRVPYLRLCELSDELHLWLSCKKFTIKDLQSLLAKLSCVTACVHASQILVLCLLNALRTFPPHAKQQPVTLEMRQDLSWWKTFLPLLNSVSVIKPMEWFFDKFAFQHRCLYCSWQGNLRRSMPHICLPALCLFCCDSYLHFRTLQHHCCCEVLGSYVECCYCDQLRLH